MTKINILSPDNFEVKEVEIDLERRRKDIIKANRNRRPVIFEEDVRLLAARYRD